MESVAIARAPVCISLGGDLGHLANCYEQSGGLVVSAAIGYYVYSILTSSQLDGVQIAFGGRQVFSRDSTQRAVGRDSELGLLEAIARYFNIGNGQRVFVTSQVPTNAGLALRGSLAVSMIKALALQCGLDLGPQAVAELACYIENEKLEMCTGRQSAYAAAFGGLSSIAFSADDVIVERLHIEKDTQVALERRLLLFSGFGLSQAPVKFYGQEKNAQRRGPVDIRSLDVIKEFAQGMRSELEKGNLDAFGKLLHLCWMEKSLLMAVEPFVNQCYQTALENGALGGEATCAEGGIFLILYCPEAKQTLVAEALAALGLQRWPLTLEDAGVQVMQAIPRSWSEVTSTVSWAQPVVSHHASFAERSGR